MSVERKASGREFFSFALPLFIFYGLGRWKGKGAGYFLLPAVALLVCMPVDRVSECARHFFSVCAPPGFFYGRGVGKKERVPAGLTLSDDAFSMYVSGPGGRALTFNSYGLGGAEGNKVPAFLSSQQRCFWYACQRTGKAITRKISAFCVFTVKFSRTWWERKKRSAGTSLLSTTALGTHAADRENERAGHFNFLCIHRSVFTDWVGGGEKNADDS